MDIDRLYSKADAIFDESHPGFVHAKRVPLPGSGRTELQFPCGLVCETNSSPIETELMYNEIFVEKVYFRGGIQLDEGATVIDVGANIGVFAMFLLRKFHELTIHSIEPVPSTFETLKRNLNRSDGSDRCHTHNTALGSDPDSQATIFMYTNMTGNSTFHPETKQHQRKAMSEMLTNEELGFFHAQRRLVVPTTTLSSLVERHVIRQIDLLKIDAEGSEIEILAGLKPDHWSRVRQVAMEIHDEEHQLNRVMETLTLYGLRPVADAATRDGCGAIAVTARRW